MSYTIPDIPATATSIGLSDLFEISNTGTSKQIAWSSILGTAQTWTAVQTFVAPILGAATATSINKVTITAPATGATLTIADGKTLTVSNNATVSGTNTGDSGTVTTIGSSDSTLTVTNPTTTPNIVLNLAHTNIWTAPIDINLNASALPTPLTGSIMQLAQVDTTVARMELNAFGAQAFYTSVAWGGTKATPTALASGTQIGGFNFYGYNGTSVVGPVATFRCFASETWTNTGPKQGSYAEVAVTATAGSTLTSSMRWENDGGVTLPSTVTGGSKGAGTINVTGGFYVNGTIQTPGTGTVTSVDTNSTMSGGIITTTGTLSINLANPNTWTGLQTYKISDAATNTVTTVLTLTHDTSGTPAASYGTGLLFQGQDTTTVDVSMASINSTWLVATHNSRSSQIQLQTVSNAGALSAGLIVGSGISGATAGLIIGGQGSVAGGIWYSGVTPSSSNYALNAGGSFTAVNSPSGTFLQVGGLNVILANTSSISFLQPCTTTITSVATGTNDGLVVTNTTAAAAGAQQYSPVIRQQGLGWKTTATAASQSVAFATQVVPVQGTTNPTGNWVLSSNINAAGFVTCLTVGSTGNITQPNGATLTIGNTATTGLSAGVLAALTNASIVITDQSGQAYRVPCVI